MESSAVVVAEAPDVVAASIWVDALQRAGIEAGMFEKGVGAALGGAVTPGMARYAVVVPRHAFVGARNVIAELGGAARLVPYRDARHDSAALRRGLGIALAVLAAILLAGAAGKLLG
jgi:hypothetical protein